MAWDVIYALANLPPIHRDPFDRLLIAQTLSEQFTFGSGDATIAHYTVPILSN